MLLAWLSWQQVENLCGEGGQLGRLRSDLVQLSTSNRNLEMKLANLSQTPGRPPPGKLS